MAVTASMVKELREMTGAGMMDCKKALSATDGDFDKAIEFLREKGLATAEKKAGRIAAEGLVATTIKDGDKVAAIVEVNAETDFVAKNEVFRTFVKEVVEQAADTDAADIDAFKAEKWALDTSMTVDEKLAATTCFQFSYQYWIKDGQDWIVRKYQTESKQSVQHLLTRKQKLHGKTSSHSFMNMVQQVLSDISQTLQL